MVGYTLGVYWAMVIADISHPVIYMDMWKHWVWESAGPMRMSVQVGS